jgi:long-chain acyl-CoA synthetase
LTDIIEQRMHRDTLLDFFDDLARTRGVFLAYDNGYRRWTYTYTDVTRAAGAFAARLADAGLVKGDAVVFWSENRPEWVAALWGCWLQGIVAVPIDYRASSEFLLRVANIVKARLVLPGDEVDRSALACTKDGATPQFLVWPLADLDWSLARTTPRAAVTKDDVAEIIFTSGATAEPKGVVITHRNVLANIVPVEREIVKYRQYARPFSPIRFLNLLPLSHMFGQSMTTFIPPILAGTVVFIRGYNPQDIVAQIRARRISVLVSVPKILDVLKEHILRVAPEADALPPRKEHFTRRWWRYRRVHRAFGLKFWSFVVGAAPLDPALEEFWGRLGFAVIQGYGLTETAPIVSLNHPFSASKGSVGKAIGGVEVKIAPDGEILVRGENVTRGYFEAPEATATAFEGGWFHTGDVGEVDASGRLFIKGRKKEMIVTPEGLNVFPEDVERVVAALPGVRDVAVVGRREGSEERVHAVVVVDPGIEPHDLARLANLSLLDHQKIRGVTVWPEAALPRTDGTRKVRRREIQDWLATGAAPRRSQTAGDTVAALVSHFAGGRQVEPTTTIDELGLSSLERVELMVAIEERFGITLDEAAFSAAHDVAALERLVAFDPTEVSAVTAPASEAAAPAPAAIYASKPLETIDFPAWNRGWAARAVRRASQPTWLLPLARLFAWVTVEGKHHLDTLEGPVIFAANHQSHMDTPAILWALPARWRYWVAVAMAKEFFKAHFFPEQYTTRQWFTSSLNYYLAALFFNAFPIPQREAGARQTLRYIGELLTDGWSVLIFPEGKRTMAGEINTFRPGIGMIGARLHATVVPVRLDGLERVLHQKAKMATPGRVRVAFGPPLRLEGDDYAALARQVEGAVRAL